MKKKSIKRKVLTGAVAVGLLSGVGMAFANTDAGAGLKAWYQGMFDKSANSVASQSANYANSKLTGLNSEYNGLKSDATKEINSTRDLEINNAATQIQNAKQSHIDSLNGKEAEISNNMDEEFRKLFEEANGTINLAGKLAFTYAEDDLGKHTGAQGSAALAKVNQDLTKTKNEAIKELEGEIASAKGELQKQLADQTNLTVKDINKATDDKIGELRGKITDKKNELVRKQQAIIAAEAQKLEDSAKVDLDAVVSSINK